MQFYKIDIPVTEGLERGEPRRKEYQEWPLLDGLTSWMEDYYLKSGKKSYFLAADVRESEKCNYLTLVGFLSGSSNAQYETAQMLQTLGVEYEEPYIQELTVQETIDLVYRAYQRDTIDIGTDDVWNLLGLGAFDRIHRFKRTERVVEDVTGINDIMKRKELVFCAETLQPELERIFQGRSLPVAGIPVHYLVSAGNDECRTAVIDALVGSLAKSGRINSRRLCALLLDDETDYDSDDEALFETYYRAADGGAVIIEYSVSDFSAGSHKTASGGSIDFVCGIARKYRECVLTILCLPAGESGLERSFRDELGEIDLIDIRTQGVSGKNARAYLRTCAEEKSLAPTDDLYRGIEDNQTYIEPELNAAFARWYNNRLKIDVYPQYSFLANNVRILTSNGSKGSAYQELQDLVGLTEVKRTVQRVVDYRKAARLLCERGVSCGTASMHMVFTGNPGTAKTTVARLFAQIMKENKLLPVGRLIEVGRANLVGRYVGWTAPMVKRRFDQAKGSVLFIDEAYSLLDGTEGEYGDEAINTIVQEMENRREDVIVIFAGYPEKMEKFLARNPGLRSRIAFHLSFDDYAVDELYSILEMMARNNHISLANDVRETVLPIFRRAELSPDFGNGRFVRNIFEQARMNQAGRLLRQDSEILSTEQLTTLRGEDFTGINQWHTELQGASPIGFAV